MESSLTATVHGRVREVLVSANAQVPRGQAAVTDRSARRRAERRRGGRAAALRAGAELDTGGLERLGWAVLGYDVTADEVSARARDGARGGRSRCRAPAARALRRRAHARPPARRRARREQLGSPQEHLHAFLRSLDAEAEGLPERFVAHLGRALAHYGVESLERTGALEDAGYRLFLAQSARPYRPRGACGACSPRGSSAAGRSTTPTARCWTASRPRSPRASPPLPSWRARSAGAAATSRRWPPRARRPTPRWRATWQRSARRTTAPSASRALPRWSTARSRWPRC